MRPPPAANASEMRCPGVDVYIAAAPREARPILRKLRGLVRSSAPEAKETLSYRIPY